MTDNNIFQVEKTLRALPKLDSSPESDELRSYYDLCAKIVKQQQSILRSAVSQQQGSKVLGPGRVVVVRDGVSDHHLRALFVGMNESNREIVALPRQSCCASTTGSAHYIR